MLEKRVKSRFSHLQIYFPPPANFEDFFDSFESLLIIEKDDVPRLPVAATNKFNDSVARFFEMNMVQDFARKCYEMSNDIDQFKQLLVRFSAL
jgi:hypothetical protein